MADSEMGEEGFEPSVNDNRSSDTSAYDLRSSLRPRTELVEVAGSTVVAQDRPRMRPCRWDGGTHRILFYDEMGVALLTCEDNSIRMYHTDRVILGTDGVAVKAPGGSG